VQSEQPAARGLRAKLATSVTILRVAFFYALFSVLKRVMPVRVLVRIAWTRPRPAAPQRRVRAIAAVVHIGRVAGASRGDCLQSALVLYRELSAAGDHPRLVMGLVRDYAVLTGHAWVEVDGKPIAESTADLGRFTRVMTFGPEGRLETAGTERV